MGVFQELRICARRVDPVRQRGRPPSGRPVSLRCQLIAADPLSTRLNYATKPDICQRWAKALLNHTSRPDGIIHRSSRDADQICVALFDRGASKHPSFDRLYLVSDSPSIMRLMVSEDIGLIDDCME